MVKRADLQAREYNRSGCARTRDWVHPTVIRDPLRGMVLAAPKARPGRGRYKMRTGESIVQTAFAPPQQAGRTASKCDGGSHAHNRKCSMYTADLVETRQNERDDALWHRSVDHPLDEQYVR